MSKKLEELLSQLLNLHPKYIDLSLNRLIKLLKKLNNPHHNLPPIIHIAGTNGKGSTLSFIRHILIEHNLKVHAYISPHLNYFNERIILSNKEIKTLKLNKTLAFVKKKNNNEPITFFEITTAAAFYLFSKEKADFLILETGLGGRFDATNVINNNLLSIITSIGIDHKEFLGNSILKITNEKLGIIKKNSNIIIAKQKPIVRKYILKKLYKNNIKNTTIIERKNIICKKNESTFSLKYKNQIFNFKKPRLLGNHQIDNATTAIISIFKLNELGYKFTIKKIKDGIIKTKWPGRLEKGHLGNINVYLDGAHNIDGATQILNFFKNKNIKVWLIIGMLNNKDIYNYLRKIQPILEGVVAVKIPGEKNSFTTVEISKICEKLKLNNFQKPTITKANNFLLKKVKAKNLLISGSLYLVGKIRDRYL